MREGIRSLRYHERSVDAPPCGTRCFLECDPARFGRLVRELLEHVPVSLNVATVDDPELTKVLAALDVEQIRAVLRKGLGEQEED
jgi:hypothetical protein